MPSHVAAAGHRPEERSLDITLNAPVLELGEGDGEEEPWLTLLVPVHAPRKHAEKAMIQRRLNGK